MPIALIGALVVACSSGTPPVPEDDPPGDDSSMPEAVVESEDEGTPTQDEPDETPPEPEPEPPLDPDPEPDVPETVLAYFDAFATDDPDIMEAMLDHVEPGSPAAIYTDVQIAAARATRQQGTPNDPHQSEVTDDGIDLCPIDDLERECLAYENFTITNDRLVTFSIDGIQIDDRLAAGGATSIQGDVEVELVGAYRSIASDTLLVAVNIRNDGDRSTSFWLSEAAYVSADGRQLSVSAVEGLNELRAGASSVAVFYVPQEDVGGTFFVVGRHRGELQDIEWELPI